MFKGLKTVIEMHDQVVVVGSPGANEGNRKSESNVVVWGVNRYLSIDVVVTD